MSEPITQDDKLAECAHCGAPGYLLTDSRAGTFKIKCTGCEVQTKPSLYKNDVVTAWNTPTNERAQIVAWLRDGLARSKGTMDPVWTSAFNQGIDYAAKSVERGDHLHTATPTTEQAKQELVDQAQALGMGYNPLMPKSGGASVKSDPNVLIANATTDSGDAELVERLRRSHGTGDLHLEAADAIERLATIGQPTTPTVERDAIELAREAMFGVEVARTDVVKPVNGSAPYSIVKFAGAVMRFYDSEWANSFERDAGTGQAAEQAQRINDLLFDVAKRGVAAAIGQPTNPTSDLTAELVEALAKVMPIRVHDGPEYAEVYFADGSKHSTQAMTMNPQDWLDLQAAYDAAIKSSTHAEETLT